MGYNPLVNDRDTVMGGAQRAFPSTIWSDILSAADPSHPQYRERLNRLVQTYWKPVYAYIRAAWRKPVEDAKDLAQAFFAHVLEKEYLARLRPEQGSFRGYLKKALKHFLIDAARAESVRASVRPVFTLEASPAELERLGIAATDETPEQAYDREWFDCLFDDAVGTLRNFLSAAGKHLYFEIFKIYCLESDESPTYASVADRLGIKETDVRNHLTYTRQVLRQILRERIREYVASDDEIEGELAEVLGR